MCCDKFNNAYLCQFLKYKTQILGLMSLLIDKCKSERGYSGTGRLINRIMYTMTSAYPIRARFLDADEWNNPGRLLPSR